MLAAVLTADCPGQDTSIARFEPIIASGRIERTLRQIDALCEDAAWGEAIDLIEDLRSNHAAQLLPVPGDANDDWRQYETVAQHLQRLLAGLNDDGLRSYRDRVDPTAKRLYEDAIVRRDEALMRRVAEEFFASDWSDKALLALGEMALERGDTAAARRRWRKLLPEVNGPHGESIADALFDVDPGVAPQRLAEAWLGADRPVEMTTLPDSDLRAADVVARLAIASLIDKDLRRARIELRLLEAAWPEASGRIAGRDQPYVAALNQLIEAEEEAPSSASTRVSRPSLSGWALESPIALPERDQINDPRARQMLFRQQVIINQMNQGIRVVRPNPFGAFGQTGTAPAPIAGDRRAFYVTLTGALRQIDFQTRSEAPAPFVEQPPELTLSTPNRNRLRTVRDSTRIHADTLTHHDGVLYFVQAETTISRAGGRSRAEVREILRGIDLERDAKEVFELKAEDLVDEADQQSLLYAGAPVVRGRRLVAPLVTAGAGAQFSLGCFDDRGRRKWITPIGTGQYLQRGAQRLSAAVVVGDDTAYVATNLGAVAAVDLTSGLIRWLTRYPRAEPANPQRGVRLKQPSDAVLSGDQLFVAPTDTDHVIAIDAATGQVRWSRGLDGQAGRLLGLSGGSLVVGGDRLRSLDPLDGSERFVWPDNQRSGLRGMGRGLLVGHEAFWPTRDEVYVLDARTGHMTRPPLDTSSLGGQGANLAIAGERVVVMGDQAVSLLGSPIPTTTEPEPQFSRLMDSGVLDQMAQTPSLLTSDL